MIVITRADLIKRLRSADRALLLRELAPVKTQEGIESTRAVLLELQQRGLVTMNPQTDRWTYTGPRVNA